MAHGKRAEINGKKFQDKEFWSPRLPCAGGVGSIYKDLTHSKDRMRSKKILKEDLKETD